MLPGQVRRLKHSKPDPGTLYIGHIFDTMVIDSRVLYYLCYGEAYI